MNAPSNINGQPATKVAGAGPHADWSPEMREIFASFIGDRHPISEISEIFGISRVSVRVRAARMAREKREGGAE